MSNLDAGQLREAAAALGDERLVALQNEYSLLEREAEAEVLPLARELGVGFVPYFPLASGLLTGKFRRGEPLPAGTRLSARPERFTDAVFDRLEALEAFAAERGHTLLELAIAALASQPGVASVIAGAMSPEQVAANAAAVDWQLDRRPSCPNSDVCHYGCALSRLTRLRRSALVELIFIGAIALSLAVAVQAYAVKPYAIPSGSMEPTLKIGDRVLVDRVGHRLGAQPEVGDIIVFHPPAGADADAGGVRRSCPPARRATARRRSSPARRSSSASWRSAATPWRSATGTSSATAAWRPSRSRPTAAAWTGATSRTAITVPEGSVYLMGDNRGASLDSRFWGPVPVSWVIGQARAAYWPPSHLGAL